MNDRWKSDGPVVPGKSSNKVGNQTRRSYGESYTGTKAETLETAKDEPTALNADEQPTAEEMEGRGPAKVKSLKQNAPRTQRRTSAHSALERIRQLAGEDKKQKFTALFHHVYDIGRLRSAFLALRRDAASGVDGVTWGQYRENLESNLEALSERLKRGAYRAMPVRRSYIPKTDGRLRPLGVPTLEDKIVQRATVDVLNAIYELLFRQR